MDKVTLKDFVAETLASISDGVRKAQEYSRNNKGVPIAPHTIEGQPISLGDQLVKFQVVVEVFSEKEGNVKGLLGATVLSLVSGSVDGEGRKLARDSSQQTIEFSIPMHFHLNWGASDRTSEEN